VTQGLIWIALLACADRFQTPLREPTPAEAATKGFQRCRRERASRSSALPDVWERRVRGCVADTRLLVRMSGHLYSRTPLIGDVTGRFRRYEEDESSSPMVAFFIFFVKVDSPVAAIH
jgi:hypothetical protein